MVCIWLWKPIRIEVADMKREPLRVPQDWQRQDRQFVIQLERVLDDVYSRIDTINKKLAELENAVNAEDEE